MKDILLSRRHKEMKGTKIVSPGDALCLRVPAYPAFPASCQDAAR